MTPRLLPPVVRKDQLSGTFVTDLLFGVTDHSGASLGVVYATSQTMESTR